MSANATTTAPTGRESIAQGKERSDATLGHRSQNASSPEGAKEGRHRSNHWRSTLPRSQPFWLPGRPQQIVRTGRLPACTIPQEN